MVPETASRKISYRLAISTLPPSRIDLKKVLSPITNHYIQLKLKKRTAKSELGARSEAIPQSAIRIYFGVLGGFYSMSRVLTVIAVGEQVVDPSAEAEIAEGFALQPGGFEIAEYPN